MGESAIASRLEGRNGHPLERYYRSCERRCSRTAVGLRILLAGRRGRTHSSKSQSSRRPRAPHQPRRYPMLQKSPMYAYIPVKDVARARTFYEQKLGLKPKQEVAGGVAYEFGEHTA